MVTPLVVLVASLAARRWGDAVGGWLVGLPLTSGPVSVFLAIEQGPSFAAQAADGSIAGVLSQCAFCLGYAALARQGAMAALGAGTLAYVVLAIALVEAGLSTVILFAAALAALALVLWLLPRRSVAGSANVVAWWDMPLRIAVTTALVVGLTSAATTLGPRASGITASYPLIGASIAAFAQWKQGVESQLESSCGIAEPSQHEADGGETKEHEGCEVEVLPVLGQSPTTVEQAIVRSTIQRLGNGTKPFA